MKRVLIVSYRFPPQQYIGSLRLEKLAKYLPEFGWEPIILTVTPERCDYLLPTTTPSANIIRTRDFELVNEFKKRLNINPNDSLFNMEKDINDKPITKAHPIKLKTVDILRWLFRQLICFPDSNIGWYHIIKKNYTDLLKDYKIDLLFSSSLPNTAHLIGHHLKEVLHVPWIADFRDLWTQNHYFRRIYPLWKIEQKLEKNVLKTCNAMVTVSKPLAEQLKMHHKKHVAVITNGFDWDDYNCECAIKKNKNGKLRIVYTGMIHSYKQDPTFLFSAVQGLLNEGFLHKEELSIDFYGHHLRWVKQISQKWDIKKNVNFHGAVPYKKSIQKQREADILLLLKWMDKQAKGIYTGKVFEYLGAGKPILAVGPSGGVLDELLKETGAGLSGSSVEEVKTILKNWILSYRQTGTIPYHGNNEIISNYSRRTQAKNLAEFFNYYSSSLDGK